MTKFILYINNVKEAAHYIEGKTINTLDKMEDYRFFYIKSDFLGEFNKRIAQFKDKNRAVPFNKNNISESEIVYKIDILSALNKTKLIKFEDTRKPSKGSSFGPRRFVKVNPYELKKGTGKQNAAIYLISDDGKILVHKRANHLSFGGSISVPGGHVDPTDNNSKEGAIRELKEETGIVIHPNRVKFLAYTGSTDIFYAIVKKDLSDVTRGVANDSHELASWPSDTLGDPVKGDSKSRWLSYQDIIGLSYIDYPSKSNYKKKKMPTAHPSLFCTDNGNIRTSLSILKLRKRGFI